jgi:hypothetical protein
LQYELEVLDELISDTLHPKNLLRNKPDSECPNEWIELIQSEKECIRKNIRKSISSILKVKQKELYIRNHQRAITRLLDAVIHYLMPKHISDVKINGCETAFDKTYKTAYHALNELLTFLRQHYPIYFDKEYIMSDGYKWQASIKIGTNLKTIRKHLSVIKASDNIFELICEPFNYFLIPEIECNYVELEYIEELQKHLLAITRLKAPDTVEKITEQLFYLNFNSVLFYNYSILQLKEEASKMESSSELVEYYSLQLKILNQQIVKPNCSYLPHFEPIRDQLTGWIAEELHYFNKKQLPLSALPVPKETAKATRNKVHVNLTVPDLSLGVRLLLDDVILNSNYSEVIEKVAKNFRTNRRESLSNSNTYNEGFNISVVTKEKVKALLMKMARKINDY